MRVLKRRLLFLAILLFFPASLAWGQSAAAKSASADFNRYTNYVVFGALLIFGVIALVQTARASYWKGAVISDSAALVKEREYGELRGRDVAHKELVEGFLQGQYPGVIVLRTPLPQELRDDEALMKALLNRVETDVAAYITLARHRHASNPTPAGPPHVSAYCGSAAIPAMPQPVCPAGSCGECDGFPGDPPPAAA